MSRIGKVWTIVAMGVVALLSVALLPSAAAQASASEQTPYYLALGDSLAQGVQPNALGQSLPTNHGYVDDLYSFYRRVIPGLKLEKLGCPGETTASMINGGKCNGYPAGNQLTQAKDFLATHRVVLITLDIGANNVDDCVTNGVISVTCVTEGIHTAGTQLATILGTLRSVAPHVPLVGMNYYDPFLAEWLSGPAGQVVANNSVTLDTTFNGVLDSVYAGFGAPVADVQDAFQTTNSTILPFLGKPVNVALICAWTWMCAASPQGPNIHANTFGYSVIAWAFMQEIRASHIRLAASGNPSPGRRHPLERGRAKLSS